MYAQCGPCSATTFTVNLSSVVDTVYTKANQVRNGNCCADNNCVKFVVFLNTNSDLLNFDVKNPSPSGSAFYSINCGTLTSIGTPVCVYGQTSVCITYCKPGGDSPDYIITQTKTVKASSDKTVRVGCSATMTVTGLSAASVTWSSVFPGTQGQYNSFLSCTSGCTLTTVTPTVVVSPYIDFLVSGTPNTICGGVSKDTVRIYTVPGLTTAITPTNAVICSGGTGSVVLTSTVSGGAPPYTYTWSTGVNTNSANVGVGTYTVFIQDTAFSCPAITRTVSVLPVTTPSAPTLSNNTPFCVGQPLNLTATNSGGTTWNWTGPNSFTSSLQNPTIPVTTLGANGTYSATMSFSGCTGPPGTTAATISPIPAAPSAGTNSTMCAGQTINLTATFTAGATYSWSGPNGFTSTLQNPTIPAATTAASGAYSVAATIAGCQGPAGTVSVTVNPIPAAPTATNNSVLCAGQSLNLSAGAGGTTYSWTGPNGFTATTQNPTIPAATTLASGTYSVTQTVLGCTSPAGTTAATINPIPAAPVATNNSAICAGQTLTLTSSVSGSIYNWTGPNGFTATTQNPTIPAATTLASGTYSITQTVLGCTSSAGTTAATINPIPAAPVATNNSAICAGQTLTLTSSVSGSIYNWTGPNGFTSTTQNPTIPAATTLASGTYSITQTVLGCTSSAGTTAATINPIPAAPVATNNSAICAGQTLTLTSSVSGSIYNWTGPNGFTSTTQNPTIPATTTLASGTYSITQTVLGCTSSAGTTAATINPIPAAPVATNNSAICAGQTLTLTSSVSGSIYNWTGPNGFTATTQNPTIPATTTLASGTYSVTQTVLGCTSSAGTTAATINPIPAAPVATNNSAICAGQTLTLTSSVSGSIYSWTGPNGFTATTQNPTISATTTLASGTYSVTQTVLGCTSPAGTTAATINPIPAAPVATNNSAICAGQTLTLTSSVSGSIYNWTGPNGFSATTQNPTIPAATTLASGTYSVTQTVLGCTSPAGTTAATINPIPAAPVVTNNSAICAGQTLTLTSSVSGSIYSWTGPNGFTSTTQNPTIPAATTLASGTYSVTQTVLGCTSPAGTTAATINPIPAAPVATNNSAICAGQTLNLTSSVSGSIYSWTGPNGFTSTTQNPTIPATTTLASGTYSVTQTVLGCTSLAGTTAATINAIPAAPVATNNSAICAGQTLTLTSSVSGSIYNWTGPNGFTATTQNPTIPATTTLASGTYSVTQTVLGCTSLAGTTAATINAIPAAPVATNNSAICAGQTLNLTSTFTTGASYNWSGPNSFTSTVQNPVITASTISVSGTYSVFATINGCSGPMGITTVTINPIPAAPTASNNSGICAGQTLSLTANPSGSNYNWTGPNGFTSTSQNPTIVGTTTTTSGSYSVTQTLLGCTSPAGITTATVSLVPGAPSAASNSSICASQTLSLTASAINGAVYNWTGPNTFTANVQNPTIAPASTLASGTYSVFADVNGCVGPIGTVNVGVNPIPSAPTATNNSSLCAGQTLNLTANPSGSIYNWSGPNGFSSTSQNPTLVNTTTLATGDYSVTQTVLGCTGPSGITSVTINPIPAAPFGNSNSPVCGGLPLVFTINTTGGTYNWTGPNSFSSSVQNPTISPATVLANGNYSVTTTILGCTSPAGIVSASVGTIPDAPAALANSPLCIGSNLNLSASFTTGVVYTWSGPNSFTSTSQNPTITGASTLASGVYTVNGNINGCNGPSSTLTVSVDIPAIVDAGAAKDTICAGALLIPMNGTVTGNGVSGTWSTLGAGSFANPNNLSTSYFLNPADTVAGVIKQVLTSSGGACPAVTDTIIFTVLKAPFIDVGLNLNVCKNAYVVLNATITGVTNTGTWTTSGSGSFNPNLGSLNGFYIPSTADTAVGSIKLVLETTNNKGCQSRKDSLLVTFIPSPIANFVSSTACANKPINFIDQSTPTASLATYSWNFGDGGTSTNANPTYTYGTGNTYTVQHIVTLTNGCKDTIEKPVTVFISPLANFTSSNVCAGNPSLFFDSSSVNTGSLVSWNWNFGDGGTDTIANPTYLYNNTGTFPVSFTVTSSNGCSTLSVKNIVVNPKPKADYNSSSTTIVAYDNISFTDLSSTPAPGTLSTWSWNFGNSTYSSDQNPTASWSDKGIYSVVLAIRDNFGCVDTIKKDIIVTLLPMVPTAFTPNGDGFNDELFVKGGPFVKMSFRVYNSWGELLFNTDLQEKGWDGKYKGQPVPLGVYVWILDVDLYNGQSVRKTGDITVLK